MNSFCSLKEVAANLPPGEKGSYNSEMFFEDFPQFTKRSEPHYENIHTKSLVPHGMLELFINNANAVILPTRWFEKWRYACGLYVAHNAALYLKTYSQGSESAQQAAASGAAIGLVSSATLGDSSVSYDNAAMTTAAEKWGAWNSTQYGQLLVTEARLIGMGGMLVL